MKFNLFLENYLVYLLPIFTKLSNTNITNTPKNEYNISSSTIYDKYFSLSMESILDLIILVIIYFLILLAQFL